MIYIAIHIAVLILFYRFILWINTEEVETKIMDIPDSDGHHVWKIDVYRFGKLKKTKYDAAKSYVWDDSH